MSKHWAIRAGIAFFVPLGITSLTVGVMRGHYTLYSEMHRETVTVMLLIAVWAALNAVIAKADGNG